MECRMRHKDGHWGIRFYQPKWTSTHYTILDLKNLQIDPQHELIQKSIMKVLDSGKATDGGICLGPSTRQNSDICVNGMVLNYASYFQIPEEKLYSIVDAILHEIMPDGGFNCMCTRSGAVHSSLHSTISVLEGFIEFLKTGSNYRNREINQAIQSSEEFVLIHHLFRSDHTGVVINQSFLNFTYPCRWKYDILRAMDYFQNAGRSWDYRMMEAVEIIQQKRTKSGVWKMNSLHPGEQHFLMEKAGQPSRWNTLRALRILNFYKTAIYNDNNHHS